MRLSRHALRSTFVLILATILLPGTVQAQQCLGNNAVPGSGWASIGGSTNEDAYAANVTGGVNVEGPVALAVSASRGWVRHSTTDSYSATGVVSAELVGGPSNDISLCTNGSIGYGVVDDGIDVSGFSSSIGLSLGGQIGPRTGNDVGVVFTPFVAGDFVQTWSSTYANGVSVDGRSNYGILVAGFLVGSDAFAIGPSATVTTREFDPYTLSIRAVFGL